MGLFIKNLDQLLSECPVELNIRPKPVEIELVIFLSGSRNYTVLTSSYSRESTPSDFRDSQFIAADRPPPQAGQLYQLSSSTMGTFVIFELTVDDCDFMRDDLI